MLSHNILLYLILAIKNIRFLSDNCKKWIPSSDDNCKNYFHLITTKITFIWYHDRRDLITINPLPFSFHPFLNFSSAVAPIFSFPSHFILSIFSLSFSIKSSITIFTSVFPFLSLYNISLFNNSLDHIFSSFFIASPIHFLNFYEPNKSLWLVFCGQDGNYISSIGR